MRNHFDRLAIGFHTLCVASAAPTTSTNATNSEITRRRMVTSLARPRDLATAVGTRAILPPEPNRLRFPDGHHRPVADCRPRRCWLPTRPRPHPALDWPAWCDADSAAAVD